MSHTTPADLIEAQLRAFTSWNAVRASAERDRAVATASRETRMDLVRRMEVLREQHVAIVERTDAHLRDSVQVLQARVPVRAVLAHRSAWFTDKVSAALRDRGVDVVARIANGAQAVGCVVAEQPDFLLVEDVLPMLTGVDVVREVRGYAPGTLIGAHVGHLQRVGDLLEAGAHGAWSRQVPPVEVSQGLVGLLRRTPSPC